MTEMVSQYQTTGIGPIASQLPIAPHPRFAVDMGPQTKLTILTQRDKIK